jgi:hypothetical protein
MTTQETDVVDWALAARDLEEQLVEAGRELEDAAAEEQHRREVVEFTQERVALGEVSKGTLHTEKVRYARSQEDHELAKAKVRRLERTLEFARTTAANAQTVEQKRRAEERAARLRERNERLVAALTVYADALDAVLREYRDMPFDTRLQQDLSIKRQGIKSTLGLLRGDQR